MRRQVAYAVGDTLSVVNLVRHGFGVGFLPPSIVPAGENLRLVPVRGESPQWEISLAVPSNRPLTPAAQAFADAAAGGRDELRLAQDSDGERSRRQSV